MTASVVHVNNLTHPGVATLVSGGAEGRRREHQHEGGPVVDQEVVGQVECSFTHSLKPPGFNL
jgi:hypothetical protein